MRTLNTQKRMLAIPLGKVRGGIQITRFGAAPSPTEATSLPTISADIGPQAVRSANYSV